MFRVALLLGHHSYTSFAPMSYRYLHVFLLYESHLKLYLKNTNKQIYCFCVADINKLCTGLYKP